MGEHQYRLKSLPDDELLAGLFPRTDVRDLVRRVPAQLGPTLNTLNIGCTSEKVPAEISPREPIELETAKVSEPRAPTKPGRLEPLSADRYGVHFTADGEFRELLGRVRGHD